MLRLQYYHALKTLRELLRKILTKTMLSDATCIENRAFKIITTTAYCAFKTAMFVNVQNAGVVVKEQITG